MGRQNRCEDTYDWRGAKVDKNLFTSGIETNCTLIFSVAQGMLAIKARTTYISSFIGKIVIWVKMVWI